MPPSSPTHTAALLAALWLGPLPGAVPAQSLPAEPGPEYSPVPREARWPLERGGEGGGREGGERGGRGGAGEVETDRDSFTPAVTTAGRGRLILESAYTFLDNRRVKETHSLPEFLLRYGLTERLELRLGWNYEVGGAGNEASGSGSGGEEDFFAPGKLERESNIAYGGKALVNEQRGWLPASSVILQASTPTSGRATATQFTGTYTAGWDLASRWKLDAAVRYRSASENEGEGEGGGKDHFNLWAPSVVLKAPVGERVSVHAEYFGIFSQGKQRDTVLHYFSPGAHLLITEDLEVGFRLGWGLNDQAARFFVNVGGGLRF